MTDVFLVDQVFLDGTESAENKLDFLLRPTCLVATEKISEGAE